MIPRVLQQRVIKNNANSPFADLVDYIEENKGQEKPQLLTSDFENLLDYTIASQDMATNVDKCIAVRTHGVCDISTATMEMNAIAFQNTRYKDPAYHFILAWPEHEIPSSDSIFDAAEHAIRSLGMGDHQYVLAIHGNTDNIHCHIAVNRIHPKTFKSHNIEWAFKTLHMAARESEIKHGWSHDNGIYVVETDADGKKTIVINEELAHVATLDNRSPTLPPWHDPESLDSWLRGKVSRELKRALPQMAGWNGLHAWLSQYGISLIDTGGGGMRLSVTSTATGEISEVPVSKGLRILKRKDLETRWGPYTSAIQSASIVPDLSHLTARQLRKGVQHVLKRDPNYDRPPHHFLHDLEDRRIFEADRGGSLHELSYRSLDAGQQDIEMLLPSDAPHHLGDQQEGHDTDLRRAGTGEGRSRTRLRDDSKREERKQLRAVQREDLRKRFAKYIKFSRDGDKDYAARIKVLRLDRSSSMKQIATEHSNAKKLVPANVPNRMTIIGLIDAQIAQDKLRVEAVFQEKYQALKEIRLPPLGWRTWLHEQSNLGDQAAISALRGIVYQAKRDAKKNGPDDDVDDLDSAADREQQYRRLMTRLMEEEQHEIAIRAARMDFMRPYEVDALLVKYNGIQWHVTGNGNIEYSDQAGAHLFTDRGNRVTFDREVVSDDEIRMALVHAQHKYGNALTLTGDDHVFTERMARLADEMNIEILNPELQQLMQNTRLSRIQQVAAQESVLPPVSENVISTLVAEVRPVESAVESPAAPDPYEQLSSMVLAIEPRAKFMIPDPSTNFVYSGIVVAMLDGNAGFAQHIGRATYALHILSLPEEFVGAIDVQYRDGASQITSMREADKGKDR
jgi:hypothetical protein